MTSHASHLIDINRHLEDLDNRGRRANIRVRGIPESVENAQIIPTLRRVFNSLLEGQEDAAIDFVRAHRALRPKGPDTAPPRDIICCLQNYPLKEEIMIKARRNNRVVFNGESIMLFHDLSQITLRNRRALRPLLEVLREKELIYSWRFPFALVVTKAGRQHVLRSPADLPEFFEALDLDPVAVPEWYQEFALPRMDNGSCRSPLSTPEKRLTKRPKQNRGHGSQSGTPNLRQGPSRAQEED